MHVATLPQSLSFNALDRGTAQMPAVDVLAFAAQIAGGVLVPADAPCEEARKVWNARVDRHMTQGAAVPWKAMP